MHNHCNHPDCPICKFHRENPNESRMGFIIAASRVLSMLISVDAACLHAEQVTDVMARSIGLDPEGLSDYMKYDRIVEGQMIQAFKENTGLMVDVQIMLETLMALMPLDLFKPAKDIAMTSFLRQGREQGHEDEQELKDAKAKIDQICDGIVATGAANLVKEPTNPQHPTMQ